MVCHIFEYNSGGYPVTIKKKPSPAMRSPRNAGLVAAGDERDGGRARGNRGLGAPNQMPILAKVHAPVLGGCDDARKRKLIAVDRRH